jgi:hypothetical protein
MLFTLTVCRRLDNRAEGLSDDSPRAAELHILRARALHDVLDGDQTWEVRSWGDTDDVKPHEWVELWLWFQEVAQQLTPLAVPALMYVGKILVEAGISAATAEAIKRLVAGSRKKQEENQLRDVIITFPDGSTKINCHPEAGIVITLCRQVSVPYEATSAEVAGLEATTHTPIEVPIALVPIVRELIAKGQK